jgi:hypothetical protein
MKDYLILLREKTRLGGTDKTDKSKNVRLEGTDKTDKSTLVSFVSPEKARKQTETAINDPEISPEKGKTVPPANVAAEDEIYREAIEERSAILEFEAGYPRGEAERLACPSCTHFRRPGFSAGYCGSPERRDDLPLAYGEGHPLRQLPDDQGESCQAYRGAVEAAPDTIAERGQQ